MREERRVGRDAEAALLRRLHGLHRFVEDAVPTDGCVVPLAEAVEVDRPGEVGRRRKVVELLLHQDRVRAQVDELLAPYELPRDHVDLWMDQRLASGDRDNGGAALLDR